MLTVLLAVLVLSGCEYPRDVDGTLRHVKQNEMRVGVVQSDPWTAVEMELVKEFAARIGSRPRWVRGAESELVEALHGGQLDLVIGGLTRDSAHAKEVTMTRPYATTEVVLAAPPGTRVPDDLDGVEVGVEAHSPAAAELERQTDAEPVPVGELEEFKGVVAVENHLVDDLGLVATNRSLLEEEHSMAVPHGENAWLVELEHFLLDRGDEAIRELQREDQP